MTQDEDKAIPSAGNPARMTLKTIAQLSDFAVPTASRAFEVLVQSAFE